VFWILHSAGRRPYVTGLGLESVGITPNKRGQIEVDDHFRTKVPSIYAIGDVIPGVYETRCVVGV
jgi:dihydrolipoamide dehydrogenase